MSADDMLAAQLWPWPDPIIKRNAQGGVIFVNAAFLQLYGGQVTDWHGCAVSGWPAPVIGAQAARFETRIPAVDGEQIFDWLEYGTADGGALAISRNVTALLNQLPPQDPVLAAPIDQAVMEQALTDQVLPVHTAQPNDAADMAAPAQPAPQLAQMPPPIAHNEVDMAVQASEPQAQDIQTSEPHVQDLQYQAPQAVDAMTSEPQSAEPVDYAAPVEAAVDAPVETERDFERRALPIENGESLLGSNWRDAVIAKAVGEDLPNANEAPPVEQPMEDVAAIAAPESSLVAKAAGGDDVPRILLAEDNAINALLTRTLLEADGCVVEVVEDGSLAVDAVKAKKYDMILMDMRMPNMDGLEATRKIRSLSNEAKAIPIIALTANAFDDDRNACFDAGMNDFMTKPVSAEELQQMVQTWTKTASAAAA